MCHLPEWLTVDPRLDSTSDGNEASNATGPPMDLPKPDLHHWLVEKLWLPGSIQTIMILVDVSYAA
jgi:hypothetical protein